MAAGKQSWTSGQHWIHAGNTKPPGVELISQPLSFALLRKTTEKVTEGQGGRKNIEALPFDKSEALFKEIEWRALKVPGTIRLDHYVRADATRFFVTAERHAHDRSQYRMSRELVQASSIGDTRAIQLLIDQRGNVNQADKHGCTPLIFAATHGQVAAASLLLRSGAHADARTAQGDTPLCKASIKGHDEVVKLLLDARASVDARDGYGETPLMMAAYNNCAGVAHQLIRRGADKDGRDAQGGTPLIMAASFGNLEVARILLNAGADKDIKDKRDDSAVEYAMAAQHDDMVALLDMNPEKRRGRRGDSGKVAAALGGKKVLKAKKGGKKAKGKKIKI